MSTGNFLLFFVFAATVLIGCRQYGKEYKPDEKHTVYYKGEGVTGALAKKLAGYLKEINYFQDSIESTVQLTRDRDTFNLYFSVDASRITNGYENRFLLLGSYISENILNKAPLFIELTNNRLEPFKKLGYAKPISFFDK